MCHHWNMRSRQNTLFPPANRMLQHSIVYTVSLYRVSQSTEYKKIDIFESFSLFAKTFHWLWGYGHSWMRLRPFMNGVGPFAGFLTPYEVLLRSCMDYLYTNILCSQYLLFLSKYLLLLVFAFSTKQAPGHNIFNVPLAQFLIDFWGVDRFR